MKSWKKLVTLFMISQTVSLLGSLLVMYAILWHITLSTTSGLMMTIYVLCSFLPAVIFAPFAGVWADRLDKKKLMIFADLMIAIVTLVAALLFFVGVRDLWIVFLIAIMRAVGQAIHQPAVSAVYPSIVPKESLLKVQGLAQGIQSASSILIPLLAGLLMALAPLEYILFIDVVTAIIAVGMLLTVIKLPKHISEVNANEIKYLDDIKEGIRYAVKHPLIFNVLLFGFIFMFLVSAPAFLSYLQVARVFGTEPWRLSFLEAFFGAGMLIGSLVITLWGGFKNRLVTYFIAYIFIGVGTIGLGIPFNFWVYISFWSFVGFFISISSPLLVALIQEKVDPGFIGRIFSVFGLIHTISMPLGMLVFGPLADVMDVSIIILICGVGMTLISMMMLGYKKFIKEGLKDTAVDRVEVSSET